MCLTFWKLVLCQWRCRSLGIPFCTLPLVALATQACWVREANAVAILV
jgi:hypothetical protein